MLRIPFLAALTGLTLLAACGGDETRRFAVPPATVAPGSYRIAYNSVEVREVSLPAYAAAEEVYARGGDGALTSNTDQLWADEPTRAITLELARYLSQMTNAQVASEPWPFRDFPEVRVEIRIEELLADATGHLRLAGQYFVAPDGEGRDRSGLFNLSEPIPGQGPAALAVARGRAVLKLAQLIAQKGLR